MAGPTSSSRNYSRPNSVSVLLNKTAPGATTLSFADQQTFATGTQSRSLASADVNGDGRPDLIVANTGSDHGVGANEHDIPRRGNGVRRAGAFPAQAATPATGRTPISVAVADVNGDGRPTSSSPTMVPARCRCC